MKKLLVSGLVALVATFSAHAAEAYKIAGLDASNRMGEIKQAAAK